MSSPNPICVATILLQSHKHAIFVFYFEHLKTIKGNFVWLNNHQSNAMCCQMLVVKKLSMLGSVLVFPLFHVGQFFKWRLHFPLEAHVIASFSWFANGLVLLQFHFLALTCEKCQEILMLSWKWDVRCNALWESNSFIWVWHVLMVSMVSTLNVFSWI